MTFTNYDGQNILNEKKDTFRSESSLHFQVNNYNIKTMSLNNHLDIRTH